VYASVTLLASSSRGALASRKRQLIFKADIYFPQRFPLHDKIRLQRWVDNMKRGEWTPSRHQYLCSQHFTEDCFDVRWGIRYLKNTAIPTIFPCMDDVCIRAIHHSTT
uniref:THAP domain-containing protein 5 n=1 Tax=Mola mola TaxID=94237 RepID=A0A3Q4AG07_MOLML